MFKRLPKTTENCTYKVHPEHENRNTRVSEYLRKYGQGKIDQLPQDYRATVTDSRTTDQMLDSTDPEPTMATEELDILCQIQNAKERFAKMDSDIKFTKKQKDRFDNAIRVINDSNATYDQKQEALRVLDQLEADGLVTRARD